MEFYDRKLLEEIYCMNEVRGVGQDILIIEECSELTKEMTKIRRGGGDYGHLVEEACDVLTTVLTLLVGMGVSNETMANAIRYKCKRALEDKHHS